MSHTLDQMLLLIDGVINAPAEIVVMDRAIAAGSASEASLMLADFAIPYPTADEAQVAMLEGALSAPSVGATASVAAVGGVFTAVSMVSGAITGGTSRQMIVDDPWAPAPSIRAALLEASRDQRARDWLASLPAAGEKRARAR